MYISSLFWQLNEISILKKLSLHYSLGNIKLADSSKIANLLCYYDLCCVIVGPLWWKTIMTSNMMCLKVGDDVNLGVEPSPTGWEHVGGCEMLAALSLCVTCFFYAVEILHSSVFRASVKTRLCEVGRVSPLKRSLGVLWRVFIALWLRTCLGRADHRAAVLGCGW